ncbi:unnamed protein product [Rangifer tarandus platyrhynchus]|uniref:Uncharacterized protein n=2 Tax=Rangifer tarandus platyrhynchus TaxID=3082113 RepID=A0ABN8YUY7_RANTA|nr:unnamed protein product [Rangifer tarandus platyrhynchus]
MEFSGQECWSGLPFSLTQGIFPTQGSNPGFLHCSRILYHLSHQGSLAPSKCSVNIYGLQTADISVSAVISGSLASQTSISTTWELVGNIESQAPHRPSQSESAA